jgi:hypothetical protein
MYTRPGTTAGRKSSADFCAVITLQLRLFNRRIVSGFPFFCVNLKA